MTDRRKKKISLLLAGLLTLLAAVPGSAAARDYEEPGVPWYGETPAPDYGEAALSQTALFLMTGEPARQITVVSGSALSFSSSDPSVASVTPDGFVTAVNPGISEILVVVGDPFYGTRTLTCEAAVIEPSLSVGEVCLLLNKGSYTAVALQGIPQGVSLDGYGGVVCSTAKAAVAEAGYDRSSGEILIYGKKPGKTGLTVKIGERVLTCPIEIKSYSLNAASLILTKGKSRTLRAKGVQGSIVWDTENPRVATVTKSGVVKARGLGNTVITARTEDFTLLCPVSVADERAVLAVTKAKSVQGAVYSQEKRMQKGYYDCSSLVWRSYSPYGITLGNRYWAPTAADEAKWCVQNKKILYYKGIKNTKRELRPGDLIFYTRGENGRYRNIYHVAMFAGYEAVYDAYEERNYVYGRIVEADGATVSMNDYIYDYGGGKEIVLIARPL